MYFPFSMSKPGRKRSVVQPQSMDSEFPLPVGESLAFRAQSVGLWAERQMLCSKECPHPGALFRSRRGGIRKGDPGAARVKSVR